MPKVTVLMTVYNGERHLREAVESIVHQTFQDFEFLIINDGSTDGTRELVLSYSDPRIRLLDNGHNLGQTRSLNRGLELAEGQYIARQDADDISEPERLARQVAFLETHTEVALLGTWYTKIDTEGTPLGERRLPCNSIQVRWSLLFFCPFVHSAVMFRKSAVLEQIGFYNEAFVYAQDYELWSRIARCLLVANLGEYLVRYRITPWSMTSTYGATVHDEELRIRNANLGHLLGYDKAQRLMSNKEQVTSMTSLLLGNDTGLQPEEAIAAAEDILRLHFAFCEYYEIGSKECRTHRAELCSRIGRRIVEIADNRFDGDLHDAQPLLVKAYRAYWPIVSVKSLIYLSLKLMTGSTLFKDHQVLCSKKRVN